MQQKEPVVRSGDDAGGVAMRAPAGFARLYPGGLSGKLLLLTLLFVMLAEVLIFVPSVANFRRNWLSERLTQAKIASLAAEAFPGGQITGMLRDELLMTAQVRSIALKRNDLRRLVVQTDMPPVVDAVYDLRPTARLALLWDALAVFFAPAGRIIRVIGPSDPSPSDFIEIVIPEAPLKTAMLRFALNILGLSVLISVITAALVYFALNRMLVQPMMRLTHNMVHFSRNPEDASRTIVPSDRTDEIGTAERELAHMQQQLTQMLHQKNRLAALGLAVSKINHDLRNMLSTAQLMSDRLASLPDPAVQRFAPKLIASIDRAIKLCTDTLRFGRAEESTPSRRRFPLRALVEEVGESLGFPREGPVAWRVEMPDTLEIDADRDQLFRVIGNVCRNAVQVLESYVEQLGMDAQGWVRVAARREQGLTPSLGPPDGSAGRPGVVIDIADNGPGVPAIARANLFVAFQGSTRKGGTGLGLAIAAELVRAHGGELALIDTDDGALFRIVVPDREG